MIQRPFTFHILLYIFFKKNLILILILTFSLRLDTSFQTLFLTCHSHVQRHHPHTFDFPFISLSPSSSNHPPLRFLLISRTLLRRQTLVSSPSSPWPVPGLGFAVAWNTSGATTSSPTPRRTPIPPAPSSSANPADGNACPTSSVLSFSLPI